MFPFASGGSAKTPQCPSSVEMKSHMSAAIPTPLAGQEICLVVFLTRVAVQTEAPVAAFHAVIARLYDAGVIPCGGVVLMSSVMTSRPAELMTSAAPHQPVNCPAGSDAS